MSVMARRRSVALSGSMCTPSHWRAGSRLFAFARLAFFGAVPAALALLPVPPAWDAVIGLVRWPILAGIVLIALAIVYHYAPDRAQAKWQWISWGAAVATALWLLGSAGF